MNSARSATDGEARVLSPKSFLPSSLNILPSATTLATPA
ncbi:uncharacterized protein METZ01_LOCUS240494, partial [marine metagenome]